MLNFLENLVEIDDHISTILLEHKAEAEEDDTEPGLKELIIQLLEEAAKGPGRSAKLRVTYLLERLSEASQDLRDSGEHEYYRKHESMMKWIDRGLANVAKLVNPASEGKFQELFDQEVIRVAVMNPKDPETEKLRKERVKDLQGRWDKLAPPSLRSRVTEPSRKGGPGGIVTPGS
jgi:hypothetical protein